MDAILYVTRTAFAALCLLGLLVRANAMVASVAISGRRITLGEVAHTFVYAYLLIATLLTFIPRGIKP